MCHPDGERSQWLVNYTGYFVRMQVPKEGRPFTNWIEAVGYTFCLLLNECL